MRLARAVERDEHEVRPDRDRLRDRARDDRHARPLGGTGDQGDVGIRFDLGPRGQAVIGEDLVDDPPILHVRRHQRQPRPVEFPPAHPVAPGKGRVVDAEGHGHGGLVDLAFIIKRHMQEAPGRLGVEIADPGVRLEGLDHRVDLACVARQHAEAQPRMARRHRRRQPRGPGERGRDHGKAHLARKPVARGAHLLAQLAGIGHDPPRPDERALPLGRQAAIARAAMHELHVQMFLERADPGRERGLRDVEALGRAAEMPLAREGDQHLEAVDHRGSLWRSRDP